MKIIQTIVNDNEKRLRNFDEFMEIAGESFRTIISFPDLLRYKDVNEYLCNKTLRDKVHELLTLNQIISSDYQKINHTIISAIHMMDLKVITNTDEFHFKTLAPLEDRYSENS